ncbi:MAG: polyprenyl diphosphate synthase [Alkalispirochaeta sp.]
MESTAVSAPAHIGIIMDGNGRWATQRGFRRTRGHREGVEAAKRVILEAIAQGVSVVSLYAFSTENWRRAEEEVSFIMGLVARNLRDQYDFYRDNRIRVLHSGNLEQLPTAVQREIKAVTTETAEFDRITVNIAVNYGGRDEIIRAVNRWINEREDRSELCNEVHIREHLDQPEFPDPDLIIRTGGEMRISNFMLWECAYAELYFSDRLWPDWGAEELRSAIEDFRSRKRNYGGIR